jgi:hypothetical protein
VIDDVCQEIIEGKWHDQFVVGIIQGGAGTSTNMNANEVIANIGLEKMGFAKGDYAHLHPIDDVNRSQSTNDVYPTSVKIAISHALAGMIIELALLRDAFAAKGVEFKDILKVGRTQLQDAVPMTLGQEFNGFATTLGEDVDRLHDTLWILAEVNMGATAIGTGITADPAYAPAVVRHPVVAALRLPASDDLRRTANVRAAARLAQGPPGPPHGGTPSGALRSVAGIEECIAHHRRMVRLEGTALMGVDDPTEAAAIALIGDERVYAPAYALGVHVMRAALVEHVEGYDPAYECMTSGAWRERFYGNVPHG